MTEQHDEYRRHDPVIAPASTPGQWGVFCQACSHDAGDYVYPCQAGQWRDVPPETLVQA